MRTIISLVVLFVAKHLEWLWRWSPDWGKRWIYRFISLGLDVGLIGMTCEDCGQPISTAMGNTQRSLEWHRKTDCAAKKTAS